MDEFLKDLLPRVQKMRDEDAARAEDIFLSDGSIAISKEKMMESVTALDGLISTIKSQLGMAEADQSNQQP